MAEIAGMEDLLHKESHKGIGKVVCNDDRAREIESELSALVKALRKDDEANWEAKAARVDELCYEHKRARGLSEHKIAKINAEIEAEAGGVLEYAEFLCGRRLRWHLGRRKAADAFRKHMISKDPDVREIYVLLRKRGMSLHNARAELARVFLGCLFEREAGMPDRLREALGWLRRGRSAVEFFPDGPVSSSERRAKARAPPRQSR